MASPDWESLSWTWKPDESIRCLSSPTSISSPSSRTPPLVVAQEEIPPEPPAKKRTRKKKLHFVETATESLHRQFLKISSGEEQVGTRFFCEAHFFLLPSFFFFAPNSSSFLDR